MKFQNICLLLAIFMVLLHQGELLSKEISVFELDAVDKNTDKSLHLYSYILTDKNESHTFESIRRLNYSNFKKINSLESGILGPASDLIWVKFNIKNKKNFEQNIILSPGENLKFLQYQIYNSKGVIVEEGQTGLSISPSNRPIGYGHYGIPLKLAANEKYEVIYKFKSFYIAEALTYIKSSDQYKIDHEKEVFFWMFVLGAIFTLVLYNLYLCVTSLNTDYLFYSLYLIFGALNILSIIEVPQNVFHEQIGGLYNHIYLIAPLVLLFGFIFISKFINLHKLIPRYKVIFYSIWIFMFCINLSLYFTDKYFTPIAIAFSVLSPLLLIIIIASVVHVIVKFKSYEYLGILASFGFMLLCVSLGHSIVTSGQGTTADSNLFFVIGISIEMLIMGQVLSYKISKFKNELLVELKNSEKELEKKVKIQTKNVVDTTYKLRESQRMKGLGVIGAGLAHEINNPLAIIEGNLTRVKRTLRGLPESETVRWNRELNIIGRSVKKIAETVKSIYFFSKNDSDLIDLNEVSLINVLLKVNGLIGDRLKKRHIKIDYSSVSRDVFVIGNENELVRAFLNIIINSIEALEHLDTEEIKKITLHFRESRNSVNVIFEDSGDGISDDMIDEIFKPFYTNKKDKSHVGLGLSIAQKIIDLSGGAIDCVESKECGHLIHVELDKAA